jgi:hypothetical protein
MFLSGTAVDAQAEISTATAAAAASDGTIFRFLIVNSS